MKQPPFEYSRATAEQVEYIREAMELPENQAKFDVVLLPLDTPEQIRAAAEEWSAHETEELKHGRGVGEYGITDSSPEAYMRLLQDGDKGERSSGGRLATHALVRMVRKTRQAHLYDLLRAYYEKDGQR